jgi:hypothetical protein
MFGVVGGSRAKCYQFQLVSLFYIGINLVYNEKTRRALRWIPKANALSEHCHRTAFLGLIFSLERGRLKTLLGGCEAANASISSRNHLLTDSARRIAEEESC